MEVRCVKGICGLKGNYLFRRDKGGREEEKGKGREAARERREMRN